MGTCWSVVYHTYTTNILIGQRPFLGVIVLFKSEKELTNAPILPWKGLFGFGKDLVSKLIQDSSTKPTPIVQKASTKPFYEYCIRCSNSIPSIHSIHFC